MQSSVTSAQGAGTARRWTIRELTDSNELKAEGQELRHCVAMYAEDCAQRRCSIWSLTCGGLVSQRRRMLTIRVDPLTRTIVEARGRANRGPRPDARNVMLQWSAARRLRVERWV